MKGMLRDFSGKGNALDKGIELWKLLSGSGPLNGKPLSQAITVTCPTCQKIIKIRSECYTR